MAQPQTGETCEKASLTSHVYSQHLLRDQPLRLPMRASVARASQGAALTWVAGTFGSSCPGRGCRSYPVLIVQSQTPAAQTDVHIKFSLVNISLRTRYLQGAGPGQSGTRRCRGNTACGIGHFPGAPAFTPTHGLRADAGRRRPGAPWEPLRRPAGCCVHPVGVRDTRGR